MTQIFLSDFEERRLHVRRYLAVVTKAEREYGRNRIAAVEGRLLVLRAGTFLVLYNLIEATTRGAIEAIHDKITTTSVPFSSLTLSLRMEVIRLFKRAANPAKDHTLDDFPAAFVAVALDQGFTLLGSVDAKAIRELGECYGFSTATEKPLTWGGRDLLTIKRNRNDLAHGVKTFEEVGRDMPALELLLLARRSMHYMGQVLSNIADYLDKKDYLEKVPA